MADAPQAIDPAAGRPGREEPEAASPQSLAGLSQRAGRRTRVTPEVVEASDQEQEAEAVQRWWLRYAVATVVVAILCLELAAILMLLLFQGFKYRGFQLDNLLIGSVVGGVFLQTVWCLQNIAAHLFPEGADKLAKLPKGGLGKP